MLRWTAVFFSLISCFNVNAADNLTSLNDNGIQKWEPKEFSGKSIYTIENYKGRLALKALS
ncbi:MAG: hypothetical protein ACI8VY_000958, partial [Cellvibrionaceae bacterium]